MAVGFSSYEIARSGLFVSERGLFVTGHNISNVNTSGYVRQQAMIADSPYQNQYSKYGLYQIGLGADIQQVRQIRNTFLDTIYRQENTRLGYWETRDKTFGDVEAILGEPMDNGLQSIMNEFWDSWQELSKDPSSLTVRALVRQRGEALVQQINHMGTQLDKTQEDLNSEITVRVDEVNQITRQIAKLNLKIVEVESSGDTANDYRDQRNSLVDSLTKLANVDVTEMQDGQLDITLGGYFLVQKGEQQDLSAELGDGTGLFNTVKLKGTDIVVPIKSGILKGLLESRGEVLGVEGSIENGTPNTKADIVFAVDVSDTSPAYLDKIKNNISSYVNELVKSGIDYNLRLVAFDGTGTTTVGGVNGNYGTDVNSFIQDVISLSSTGDGGNDFSGLVNALDPANLVIDDYREDANRYAIVFTGESIDGDGAGSDADVANYADALKALGIKASIVTDSAYYTSGVGGETLGWDQITSGTGGNLYDINSDDFAGLMKQINSDINYSVNEGFSEVTSSNNIIPDLKKRLNALINIMAREVNYLHRSGTTLGDPPQAGSDFFCAIDSSRPLEMGNIKLNDIFAETNGLNYIVAAETEAVGDNTIAEKISNLRDASIVKDVEGILSMDEYYQSIILNFGYGASDASTFLQNESTLVQSADNTRQSIMGVSMDEEMTKMMKYKFAYDASSKAINAIDTMISTIIERMGLVGR